MTTPARGAHQRRDAFLVSAGTVTGVAAVYVVVVLGGGLLTGHTDSPSLSLSVLATALVAWGLEPGRAALEGLTTRLGGGSARSPYDVLSGFTESVIADRPAAVAGTAPGDLPARMARLLAEATGAAWAQVWLEVEGRSELSSTWPPLEPGAPSETGAGGRVRTREVVLDGERLGVLRLCERADQPLGPVEERLFSGLAAQAGMVLLRARLQHELASRARDLEARADELTRSRRRLVEAQDAERQRLERDIHDGAQQHLVALVVNLRLAETLAGTAPERSRRVLDEQVAAIDTAIDTLLDLSRGIYPRALTEAGVAPALRGVLATLSVPVHVVDHGIGRALPEVEAALYFCAVEAVQNAVKHARPTTVTVDLSRDGDLVRLLVRDDGTGFDASGAPTGRGLGNMRDRIDAVGGTFSLRARPGRGVEVTASVPADAGDVGP
jgi:signal transduction histidine kinase